jgi:hypothetical protein
VSARTPAATSDAFPGAFAGAVTGGVRGLLRAEGFAVLVLAAVLYAGTARGWGLFALLFFAPDLSFVAFLAGPRVGAAAYNGLHSYVGPLALVLVGGAAGQPGLLPFAYAWAAHIGFDRLVGYGLKYASGFGDTHLGRTGAAARARPA